MSLFLIARLVCLCPMLVACSSANPHKSTATTRKSVVQKLRRATKRLVASAGALSTSRVIHRSAVDTIARSVDGVLGFHGDAKGPADRCLAATPAITTIAAYQAQQLQQKQIDDADYGISYKTAMRISMAPVHLGHSPTTPPPPSPNINFCIHIHVCINIASCVHLSLSLSLSLSAYTYTHMCRYRHKRVHSYTHNRI
jgi:hypothetical protein